MPQAISRRFPPTPAEGEVVQLFYVLERCDLTAV